MGLLLLSAVVGIRVDAARGVSDVDLKRLVEGLARAVSEQVHLDARVDPVGNRACTAPDRCVPQIRERLGVEEVVLLQVAGVPKRIRVIAARFGRREEDRSQIHVELTRSTDTWASPIEGMAMSLFRARLSNVVVPPPAPPPVPPPPATVAEPKTATRVVIADPPSADDEDAVLSSPLFWFVTGAAAVAGGVALAYALRPEGEPYGGASGVILRP